MEVSCSICGKPIAPSDINLSAAIANCRNCNKVFHIQNPQTSKPKIGNIDGVKVLRESGLTIIERRWFTPVAYFLIFFCIAWNAFLIFWYSMAFSRGDTPWIMKVFPVGHVAVGFGLVYYTLCLFLNRTEFHIDIYDLKIFHKPLPWFGSGKTIPRKEIDQVYVRETISHNKNGPTTFYEIRIKTKSGAEQKIISNLHSSEEARKIEQEVESALGIQDRHVSGEYR